MTQMDHTKPIWIYSLSGVFAICSASLQSLESELAKSNILRSNRLGIYCAQDCRHCTYEYIPSGSFSYSIQDVDLTRHKLSNPTRRKLLEWVRHVRKGG